MGRSSLAPRTRTVDDDLAESNMTRQDLAQGEYSFKRVMARFRAMGWHTRPGPALSYDHFYIKPGKSLSTGVEGVDYFYGEANLVRYAVSISLFASDTPSPASSVAAGSGAMASASPTVKTETTTPVKREATKATEGSNGKRKRQATGSASGPGPAEQPSKGLHAEDAICIDSSDEDEEEEEEEEEVCMPPKRDGNPGKRKAPRIEEEEEEDEEEEDGGVQVDDGVDFGGDESDATGHSEASTAASSASNSKRPLLKTRVTKQQKLQAKEAKVARKSRYKATSTGIGPARKIKSGPRGLMVERSYREVLAESTPPEEVTTPVVPAKTVAARKSPPPSPKAHARHAQAHRPPLPDAPKPPVAHGLESELNATVKDEPPPPPVFSTVTPTPPHASPSRASSVASSQPSSVSTSNPRVSASETLLDVEGVVFPARPGEQYRALITRAIDTDETTIWMEESTSLDQRHFTFTDITELSDKPNNLVPAHALYQALFKSLVALCEKVAVHPPPPPPLEDSGSKSSSDDASSINFMRDDASEWIELRYPDTSFWSLPHRFPMTAVPVSRQVHALREELVRTKHELRHARTQRDQLEHKVRRRKGKLQAVVRELEASKKQHEETERELADTKGTLQIALCDLEAFRKQHKHLEREYESVRKELEQAKQHQQSKPPAPLPPARPRTPSPSPPKALPQAQAKILLQPQPRASAKAHVPPQQTKPQQTKAPPPSQPKSQLSKQPKTQPPPPKPVPHEQPKPLQQKSAVRPPSTSSTPSTPTTTTSVRSPAPAPTSVAEPKTFHVQCHWLTTTFVNSPDGSPWLVPWPKLLSVHPTQYTLTSENEKATKVQVNVAGSYHVKMAVNHAPTMRLCVVVTGSAGSSSGSSVPRVSTLNPHLVEIGPKGDRYKSHFDKSVTCSANDTIYAELRPCSPESEPVASCQVEHVATFKHLLNDWRVEWTPYTNAAHMNGASH